MRLWLLYLELQLLIQTRINLLLKKGCLYGWPFLFATKTNVLSYEGMIVLTTSTSPQTFDFIPRTGGYNTMILTDEMESKSTTIAISSSVAGAYKHSITATFALVEGRSYMLVLKNGSSVVYRDKVYCTDSPLQNFSVNYNQYTENVSNNEFIVI